MAEAVSAQAGDRIDDDASTTPNKKKSSRLKSDAHKKSIEVMKEAQSKAKADMKNIRQQLKQDCMISLLDIHVHKHETCFCALRLLLLV